MQGSSEKWLILSLGLEIHKMSVEHLIGRESKQVLKNSHDGGTSKGHGSQLQEFPMVKAGAT